jgi:hypothetical protein
MISVHERSAAMEKICLCSGDQTNQTQDTETNWQQMLEEAV